MRKLRRLILLVDDYEPEMGITRLVLSVHGYQVLAAMDGARALGCLHANPVDLALVVAEAQVPLSQGGGLDGIRLAEQLKRVNPGLPVVLYSRSLGKSPPGHWADLFLSRHSYNPELLLQSIRRLLIRKRGPKPMGEKLRIKQEMWRRQAEKMEEWRAKA